MKKQYISPKSEVVAFFGEAPILAASLSVDKDNTIGGSEVLSTEKGGWDSSQWTSNGDEE